MFEHFDDEARAVMLQADVDARRLGHDYLGCEHLLLALSSSDTDLSRVLAGLGLTPAAVEAVMLRVLGTPGTPDREALASIGIDLEQVRAKVEANFGPGTLPNPPSPTFRHCWARGHRCRTGPNRAQLPFTSRAKNCLELALAEARTMGHQHICVDHLALALTAMPRGLAPEIFAGVGVTPIQVRAAIVDRRRTG